MANINFEINDSAVLAAFNRLISAGSNPAPALDAVGQTLVGNVQLGFDKSVSPYGTPWLALKHRQGKPLIDSGKLRSSVNYQVSGNSVEVGTNREYAAVHQFGADIARAAYSKLVRHRTDAKGNLLRTKHFNGRGLIFAKDSHQRVQERWFEVGAHKVNIPARPFLPTDGLPPAWVDDVLDAIQNTLTDELP